METYESKAKGLKTLIYVNTGQANYREALSYIFQKEKESHSVRCYGPYIKYKALVKEPF